MIRSCSYSLAIEIAQRMCIAEKKPCTLITLGIPGDVVRRDVACGLQKVVCHEWRVRTRLYSGTAKAAAEREIEDDLLAFSKAPLTIIDDASVEPSALANIPDGQDVIIVDGRLRSCCDEYVRKKSCGGEVAAILEWFCASAGGMFFGPHEVPSIRTLSEVAKDMFGPVGLRHFPDLTNYHEYENLFSDVLYYAVLKNPDWARRVRSILETPDDYDMCRRAKSIVLITALKRRYLDASQNERRDAQLSLASGNSDNAFASGVLRFVRDTSFDKKRWKKQLDCWHGRSNVGQVFDSDGHNALWYLLYNDSTMSSALLGTAGDDPFADARDLLKGYGCSVLHRDAFGLPFASILESLQKEP